jgi:hypothetical protein
MLVQCSNADDLHVVCEVAALAQKLHEPLDTLLGVTGPASCLLIEPFDKQDRLKTDSYILAVTRKPDRS